MNILKSSSFYETPSWPNTKLPKYLNIVLKINTDLSLPNLFLNLKNIEKLIGRTPGPRNSPRVCDIDIIDYNQKNYSIKIKKDYPEALNNLGSSLIEIGKLEEAKECFVKALSLIHI